MKKLLLTSGGLSHPTIWKNFIEMVGKKPQDIKMLLVSAYVFITKQDDNINYYDPRNVFLRERNFLIESGLLADNIFEYALDYEWNQDIKQYDAIYFNGGNLRSYTSKIAKTGFANYIDELVNNNGVYIGISAGSFLALVNKTTLGYVDCKIHVHCEKGSPVGPVDKIKRDVSLTNSQALRVIGDEWTVIE